MYLSQIEADPNNEDFDWLWTGRYYKRDWDAWFDEHRKQPSTGTNASLRCLSEELADNYSETAEAYGVSMDRAQQSVDQAQDLAKEAMYELAAGGFVGTSKIGSGGRGAMSRGAAGADSPSTGGAARKVADSGSDIGKFGKSYPGSWVRPKRWRLPKNGSWKGLPGHSDFIPSNPTALGLKEGDVVPFKCGYPDFSAWSRRNFDVPGLNGNHDHDLALIHKEVARLEGLPHQTAGRRWLLDQGLSPHHVGGDSVQLIPTNLHEGVRHTGGAWELRNR